MLHARTTDGVPPEALVARGWAAPLLDLDDATLDALEIEGAAREFPASFPASLHELRAIAATLVAVPTLGPVSPPSAPRPLRRLETTRKRAQIARLTSLIMPLVQGATRVVDVGSGHGHLAREIALRCAIPVVALERDPTLTARAERLPRANGLTFELVDVVSNQLSLAPGDCALGLHACGELGDALVTGIAARGQSALLVGCCLQKRRASARVPLVTDRAGAGDVALPTWLLGLSNFTAREEGVEASRSKNLAAKERRMALHWLLARAAGPLHFGAEMDGLNRRAAHGDLADMIARAFSSRGIPAPPADDVHEAVRWARTQHARVRRLALPRALLARVLEVFVLVDRALYLENRGFDVVVGTAFEQEISARNLVLIARRNSR